MENFITTPCIIYIKFHLLSKKAFSPPLLPPLGSTNRSISPNMAISAPRGCEVTRAMTVISYLWAIYFTVDHKQEHHRADGLHNNGAIVHLVPVRGVLTQGS